MRLFQIAATGCGQSGFHGGSGLNQGKVKLGGWEHEIATSGDRFLIGRTGPPGEARVSELINALSKASGLCILCLPIVDANKAVGDVSSAMMTQGRGFFSSSWSATRERLLVAEVNHLVFAFEAATLKKALGALLGKSALSGSELDGEFDLSLPTGTHLAGLVDLIWNCIDAPEAHQLGCEAIDCLAQSVITALCWAIVASPLRQRGRPTSPAMPWHVKRAIGYMRANLGHSMTVASIAREAGISVRALQLAFRRFKGTTPLSYLQAMRLAAARDELLNSTSPPSISAVARKAGFTHMGRFAAAYSEAYGEAPSETFAAPERIVARGDQKARETPLW
ncbi:helix-turn-helix transcriptional regulator [Sinorhizobium meliloti]|uniref:helix-turn-helix transcriptional regulator n=1 Tax=Rhizobium meliloti TaxID=382 RepID=UPI0012FDCCDA|nr:helix-turn-helix transcriptional regulator [Sinorhizobium meliloti]